MMDIYVCKQLQYMCATGKIVVPPYNKLAYDAPLSFLSRIGHGHQLHRPVNNTRCAGAGTVHRHLPPHHSP